MAPNTSSAKGSSQDEAAYRRRVVVKLRDHASVRGARAAAKASSLSRRLSELYPEARVEPLITSVSDEEIRRLAGSAAERMVSVKPPNMSAYLAVEVPLATDAEVLAKELSRWEDVELAYVEGGPVVPPVNAVDDPRQVNQGYEDPAPSGINVEYAWGFQGGDGQGVGVVDIEQGWTLNHEDLVGAGVTLISGDNHNYWGHGTGVLGELVAVDNTKGDVGIVPRATARVISQWRTATSWNTADAIVAAAAAMSFGDVLLLEAQTNFGSFSLVPVEVEPAVFDAIRLATAQGIVVVEAAGNGGNDLDSYTDTAGKHTLNRNSSDFQDSGAIMVGAASATAPHTRLGFSNFGSRIDCYGWGEDVDTTGDGTLFDVSTTSYTGSFNGTSSASPIIAGAAVSVQGLAQRSLGVGFRFSPGELRTMLSDSATGTASNNPAVDRIGVMPDLRQIIDTVLNLAQDVYIRDFVGDTGDPHGGAVSASPDIILRPTAVPDPQTAFGQGSGTENDISLGFEAEAGQDNLIYVRVLNRGGSAAPDVQATVYWAPVATLVTPNLWNLIGTITIPSVPAGDVLTVSDALTWQRQSIPAPGHYCFVGIIGSAQDPGPAPASLFDWNTFISFIRNNNNITWRNFNVVDNVPPSKPPAGAPRGWVVLPFVVPGAPDQGRKFGLEVIARLPAGARAMLEAPLWQLDALGVAGPHRVVTRGLGRIPIRAHGRQFLGKGLFPANAKGAARLFVHIPEKARLNPHEIAIRQLAEDQEVGRVTWRLMARRQGRHD